MSATATRILEPLTLGDGTPARRLRARLIELGFTESVVLSMLPGDVIGKPTTAANLPVIRKALQPDTPLKVAMLLLLVADPVAKHLCADAFGPDLLEMLIDCGLLFAEGEDIVSPFMLLPYRNIFIVYDLSKNRWTEVERHIVMGVGTSSISLANATPRRSVRHALDVGCGGGFLSLQLAAHAEHVTGIDINPRSLNMARFAAALSGYENCNFVESDFFFAVDGQLFDLIVSNPPFVISPESTYQYRDGGLGGDRVSETVLRRAGCYLNEGGICLVICEWAHLRGADPEARVRGWVDGNGCDVWISAGPKADMEGYATNWLRPNLAEMSAAAYEKTFLDWLEYYNKAGIEGVQMGLVVMRKRAGANWFRFDDAPDAIRGEYGDQVLRQLALIDFLNETADESLPGVKLRLAPEVRLTQELVQSGNRWAFSDGMLHMKEPLVYKGRVDQYISGLCARCDGTAPLGELLASMADVLNKPVEEVTQRTLPLVKGLISRGFLLPPPVA